MREIAIVGSGIVGASVAYHLSEQTDRPVTVYERQAPASETTYKSMAMFGLYGDPVQYRMKRYGMALYNEFYREPTSNPRYRSVGLLRVSTTESGAAELRELVAGDTDSDKTSSTISGTDRDGTMYLEGDELKENLLIPAVETLPIEGALFRPICGYMHPQELAFEFLDRAERNGVTVESNTRVTDVHVRDGATEAIELDGDRREPVDDVVCAAGPWNRELAELAGVDLPLRHTLAPIMVLDADDMADYSLPSLSHHESPYAFYRQTARGADGICVGYYPGGYHDAGTTYDPDTYGERVPEEIRTGALEAVEELLPDLADAPIVDEWVGIRSQTPDGNPIVGWTEVEGFSVAAFNTSAIQLAPAAGKVIAEQLVDDDPTSYYEDLSISRFDGYSDHRNE